MSKTKIEWADYTFNPWIGCSKVSNGCKYCYAEELMDKRYGKAEWGDNGTRVKTSPANWKKPLAWNKQAKAEGVQYKVFCASLADVFEDREEVSAWRDELFTLINQTPHLTWLLLTKRPENVMEFIPVDWSKYMFPTNVCLGVSVEDQDTANERIPELLKVPVRVRFLSCEPLLGKVTFRWQTWFFDAYSMQYRDYLEKHGAVNQYQGVKGIHWVIVGGESGRSARPMHPKWALSLKSECEDAGIPFLFKQWGQWQNGSESRGNVENKIVLLTGKAINNDSSSTKYIRSFSAEEWENQHPCMMAKVGKKKAGRLLDGKEYSEFPAFPS